jgi:hypothetical protein
MCVTLMVSQIIKKQIYEITSVISHDNHPILKRHMPIRVTEGMTDLPQSCTLLMREIPNVHFTSRPCFASNNITVTVL